MIGAWFAAGMTLVGVVVRYAVLIARGLRYNISNFLLTWKRIESTD